MNQYCDRLKLGVKTFFRPTVTFSSASSSSSSVAYLSTTLFVVLLFLHSSIAAETASEIDETKMASSSTLSLPSAQFALSLYDILKREKASTENIFFSPLSISSVLSMTLLGAKGKTADELSSALQYPSDFSHEQFGALMTALSAVDANSVLLHIANRIFTRQGLSFLDSFTMGLSSHYSADALALDFGADPNGSRLLINHWVEEKTKTKIKDLMPDGSITSLTAAVLVNAVYFKGDWLNKFNHSLTKPGDFKASAQTNLRVNFMFAEKKFPYGRNRDLGFHLLHLPYKGEELSMVVFLPFENNGLDALEGKLSAEVLLKAVKETRTMKVEVTLPKFKIEESIDLTEKLGLLGITDLFTDNADLSGVTTDVPLKVSKVVHKSFIEVNEEGAEAAAATGAVMMTRCMPAPPPIFKADHPFLFGIFDQRTNVFLFWGRIAQPTTIEGAKDEL